MSSLWRDYHGPASAGSKSRRRGGFLFLVVLATAQMTGVGAAGPWRAEQGNTPGWALMSPEERIEHQAKVRGFTTYDDCRAYQVAHHRLMEERAAQRGLPPPGGRRDFCAHLRPQPSRPEGEGEDP